MFPCGSVWLKHEPMLFDYDAPELGKVNKNWGIPLSFDSSCPQLVEKLLKHASSEIKA